MRFSITYLMFALLVCQASAIAGTSLVNGGFEAGTYNGWTIMTNNGNAYNHNNDQALTSDQTGRSDQPLGQGLLAAEGTYFAGLCHAGLDPSDPNYVNASGWVRFRQTVDVADYNPGADRTTYDLQLWALLAATQDSFAAGNIAQAYSLYWQDNSADWYHTLRVATDVSGGKPTDGITITITNSLGVNRVYEFDSNNSVGVGNVPVAIDPASGATGRQNTYSNFLNAVNGDAGGPCDAYGDYAEGWTYPDVLLRWRGDGNSHGGHIATNTTDTRKVQLADNYGGNFAPIINWDGGFNHEYHLGSDDSNYGGGGAGGGAGFFNDQAFAQYGLPNGSDNAVPLWNKWRKVRLIGSIPDHPARLILEITLKNGNVTEYNCFDGVSFAASSATGSAILGKFTGDINNSNFETAPFDQSYTLNVNGDPAGWGWGALDPDWGALPPAEQHLVPPNSVYMNGFGSGHGPLETYTNGEVGGATNPLDTISPYAPGPAETHFLGRCQASGSATLDGYWGKVLPVRDYSPSATGFRWLVHYYTKMYEGPGTSASYQWLEFCWDAGGTVRNSNPVQPCPSVLDYPGYYDGSGKFVSAEMLPNNWFSYVRALDLYKMQTQSTTSTTSGFDEIEQIGEFTPMRATNAVAPYDPVPYAPQYVLVRHYDHGAPASASTEFKQLYDKIDISVHATYGGARPRVVTSDPTLSPVVSLPVGHCPAGGTPNPYSGQLIADVIGTATWSLVAGSSLPTGLTLRPSGLIEGQPRVAGTTTFTVQVQDAYDNHTATGVVSLTVEGPCCNAPAADLDGDGYVDMADFALLQACMTTGAGYTGGIADGCHCADLNLDGLAINDLDVGLFLNCAKGPAVPAPPTPSCP